jgi:predicted outer membrane repeat protein
MKVKSFSLIFVLICSLFVTSTLQARIIHVPTDSSTIQSGINGAVDGDTVLVARGHYYERINFVGKAILVTSNFIFDADTITIDSTIIDADTSVLGGSGIGSVVVFISSENSNSVIEGFTLINGTGFSECGGGVYCGYNTSPVIKNNTITHNSAGGGGGGIYCSLSSSPTIVKNSINDNSTTSLGGGICCRSSSSTIIDNVINRNLAVDGGGVYCHNYCSPIVSNNTISGNLATHRGGGICCLDMFPTTISNNAITGNSAGSEGGGVYCEMFYFNSAIRGNVITGNFAALYGGGISCWQLPSIAICDNTVSRNSAGQSGGGIACGNSEPTILSMETWPSSMGAGYFAIFAIILQLSKTIF